MALIAHWPLNGDTKDSSGNGNDGVNVNGSVIEDGKIHSHSYNFYTAGAFAFTGSAKYISTGESSNITKSYTLMGWASNAISGSIIGANPPVYNGLSLYITGTTAVASVNNNPQEKAQFTGLVDTWNHLTGVFDKTSGEIKIYVNGVLKSTNTTWNGVHIAGALNIGTDDVTNPEWNYQGSISDVRIYDEVLSDDEVLRLYQTRASLHSTGDFLVGELYEYENKAILIDEAINNQVFTDGLSSYAQSNCVITLTSDGYRIYRPPNLIYPAAGHTMWGGLRAYLPDGALEVDHDYVMTFKIKGQTSNEASVYFGYEIGWSTMGIGLSSHSATKDFIFTNFESTEYILVKVHYTVDSNRIMNGTWNGDITNGSNIVLYTDKHTSAPDVYVGATLLNNSYFPNGTKITGVTSDISFTVDNNATASGTGIPLQTDTNWDTYRQFKFGFSYSSTGVLGTDLYIKDFNVYDVTDGENYRISESSIAYFTEIDEVTGTSNGQAAEITIDGKLIIEGEFSEVD